MKKIGMWMEDILKCFRAGKPIIVFDSQDREGEADIVIHASFCTPERIRLMRKDAGGFICLCTDDATAKKIGVEFYTTQLRNGPYEKMRRLAISKTPYGDEPSFCTYINSKKVFTGITDEDRSTTVREFERMVSEGKEGQFCDMFYAPGHVPLLASRGIEKRKGHTEMSVELCKMANMSPSVVICEMLGDDGKALGWKDVLEYARKKGYFAVMGAELLDGLGKK